MTDTPYQYPSTTLSRPYDQGNAYADLFRGEGNKLLYELKNLMKFRNLGQLRMTRLFTDGTVITAWSFVNPITKTSQDFVEIDTSRSTFVTGGILSVPRCTITFINLPTFVQPMKYPGEIHAGEVEGIDYIKTYYTVNLENCDDCQDISWEFLLTYSTPVEPRHYHNYGSIPQLGVEPGMDDLNNHIVYSLEPPPWAEVISQDKDENGGFILWKAYTEMGDVAFSRTGLAIPLLRAIINRSDGTELCAQEQKFDVDCCRKENDLRKVEIWWEGIWECEPFIIYGDARICKMPASVPIGGSNGLIAYSTPFYAARPLYSIPHINGGCLPLEWSTTGPIQLINPTPMGTSTYFQIISGDCFTPVVITLTDRCGTQDVVTGSPCCENFDAVSILYTSLLMSCGQKQTLNATGGCGPYIWSITSGGGSITDAGGIEAVYTAPATNVNCVDNPTITVSDCCGNSAEVKLAINCYNIGVAFEMSEVFSCGCLACNQSPCDYCSPPCMGHKRQHRNRNWMCDGTLTLDCRPGGGADCSGYMTIACKSNCTCDETFYMDCHTSDCGGSAPCNVLKDTRSAGMKSAGCCPLNPLTGLPY